MKNVDPTTTQSPVIMPVARSYTACDIPAPTVLWYREQCEQYLYGAYIVLLLGVL
jgi:hypothetical protein